MTTDDMRSELLPCPFCGADSDLIHHSPDGLIATWVQCTQCGAHSKSIVAEKSLATKAAIKAWNTRPVPAGLVEKLEALKTDAGNPTDAYDDNIIDRCIEIVKAHAQPAVDRVGPDELPAASMNCPICGVDTPHSHPYLLNSYSIIARLNKEKFKNAVETGVRYPFDIYNHVISIIKDMTTLPQPVRVDVEKCQKALHRAYDKKASLCLSYADGHFVALLSDGTEAIIKTILAVVKDAAKEMGVELEYE